MADKTEVTLDVIEAMTAQALVAHGANQGVAGSVARAVRVAEAQGNLICGLYYLESYCVQLGTGRVDGQAVPVVRQPKPGSVQVDAKLGFAQPAFDAGLDAALAAARANGIAGYSIHHSHTCTSMGYFTERLARAGMIALGMTNAPACVAPPGGSAPVLGTNPVSFAVPDGDGGVGMLFDQSTSATAIGKVRVAASAGDPIPEGWAVDGQGQPTTNAKAALEGSLLSAGGYKGYGFGLMAELLAGALTGSVLSTQAAPLKTPEGPAHDLGQFYLLIDPATYDARFFAQLQALAKVIEDQPGARVPGRHKTLPESVQIDAGLWDAVQKLARGA